MITLYIHVVCACVMSNGDKLTEREMYKYN